MSGERSRWRETIVWVAMLGAFITIAAVLVLGLRSASR